MRKQWLEKYERLVDAADDLHNRIEAFRLLIDKLLTDAYRGEHDAHILILAAVEIQPDLLKRYNHIRF